MHGLMMDDGLLVSSLLAQAACNHPDTEIVSRLCDGTIHRYDYLRCEIRAKNLARAMHALGVRPGDRVATLAWNDFRHVELFYGICGIGAVCHTLNPRLPKEQLRYIAAHSQFRVLFSIPPSWRSPKLWPPRSTDSGNTSFSARRRRCPPPPCPAP